MKQTTIEGTPEEIIKFLHLQANSIAVETKNIGLSPSVLAAPALQVKPAEAKQTGQPHKWGRQKKVLSPESIKWLIDNYNKQTSNDLLAKLREDYGYTGKSVYVINRQLKALGLKKSRTALAEYQYSHLQPTKICGHCGAVMHKSDFAPNAWMWVQNCRDCFTKLSIQGRRARHNKPLLPSVMPGLQASPERLAQILAQSASDGQPVGLDSWQTLGISNMAEWQTFLSAFIKVAHEYAAALGLSGKFIADGWQIAYRK